LATWLWVASPASAQTVVVTPAPTVRYYTPPVAVPTVSYYTAPVVSVPAPTVSYYVPPVSTVTYYTAPTVSYYAPAVVTPAPVAVSTYRYGILPWRRTYVNYYSPVYVYP
jgi:hypothetical protein